MITFSSKAKQSKTKMGHLQIMQPLKFDKNKIVQLFGVSLIMCPIFVGSILVQLAMRAILVLAKSL
jgi:hypothetical protein